MARLLRLSASLLLLTSLACRREKPEEHKAPPPPPPTQISCRPNTENLPLALPAELGDFCLDAGVDVRSFGRAAGGGLDAVCVELFDGECELYKSYGLESVYTLSLVSPKGGPATVSVVVSEFARQASAFGFYSRRILGDSHPATLKLQKVELEGRGALGRGNLVLWKGKRVFELSYLRDDRTPDELSAEAEARLPELGRRLAAASPGSGQVPAAVAALESHGALAFGVRGMPDALFGQAGSGPYFSSYAELDGKKARVLLFERRDEAAAYDLGLWLTRKFGPGVLGRKEQKFGFRLRQTDKTPEDWFFIREEGLVLGLGPDGAESSGMDHEAAEKLLREVAAEYRRLAKAESDPAQ